VSKLTNEQLRSLIAGMETTLQRDERRSRSDNARTRHRREQLEAYRAELAHRQVAGADPRAHELQSVRHGEVA
jgi:hypothetical protein